MHAKKTVRPHHFWWYCLAVVSWFLTGAVFGQSRLHPPVPQTNGWMRVHGQTETNRLITLEASSNLVHWSPLAVLDYLDKLCCLEQ